MYWYRRGYGRDKPCLKGTLSEENKHGLNTIIIIIIIIIVLIALVSVLNL